MKKPREFLYRQFQNVRKLKNLFTQQASLPNILQGGVQGAKCRKRHIIAEKLILPTALDMGIMVGESGRTLISQANKENMIYLRISLTI